MNKKSVTKVFSNQRKALRLSGDTHRALKVAPWLISAAAAWLTFAPCGTALAAPAWKSDGSSALNGTLSFENTINPAERNEKGELPASWTKNGGDAKGQVELTGVRGISENIYGALVESGKGKRVRKQREHHWKIFCERRGRRRTLVQWHWRRA